MLRRSALAQTMNAFIGRFMCSPPSVTPPDTPPELLFDLEPPVDDLEDLSKEYPRATGATKQNNFSTRLDKYSRHVGLLIYMTSRKGALARIVNTS